MSFKGASKIVFSCGIVSGCLFWKGIHYAATGLKLDKTEINLKN